MHKEQTGEEFCLQKRLAREICLSDVIMHKGRHTIFGMEKYTQ